MSLAYGIGGFVKVAAGPIKGFGPPATNFKGELGQQYFDQNTIPPTLYIFNGSTWSSGGDEPATTTTFGTVQLATLTELQNGTAPAGAYVPTANDVATVIAGVVAGAVPPANETQAGIAEIATQAETDAGVLDDKIVSPLKLATYISGGGAGAGSFTDLTATGAVSFTGATGALSMTSATASSLGVTGAGIDLTLDSAAGQLILTGGEAAVNAVRIQADDAAGGIDVDSGSGGITIDSTGAVSIDAAAASNFTATGAGIDLTLASVLGSVLVSSTEDAALAIRLHANGGTSETIQIHSDQGTGVASIGLLSDAGGLTLRSTGLASGDAINLEAAAGGIDIDAALQIHIQTTQSAADSIVITSTLGGIDILASGASAGEDIDIIATGSSVNIESTENAALAVYLHANGGTSETIRVRADQGTGAASVDILSDVGGITLTAGLSTTDAINLVANGVAGGIDIDAGTGGVIVDTTGAISLDAAAASNFTATGAFDITIQSTAGSININAGEAAADAVNVDSTGGFDLDAALQVNIDSSQAAATAVRIVASNAGGGIDIDAGTTGITVDTTGAFSIDGAGASNVTVTGAGLDLTLNSVGGSVLVESTENAALAIRLHANGGTSETIQVHADQGTGVASVGLLSDVGGLTFRSTGFASADAINLEAAAGGIDMDSALQTNIASSQAAATAIQLTASDVAGGITATTGTGNFNVSGGNLSIASTGKGLLVKGGLVTDMVGAGVLTLGTQTILNTNVLTGDRIFLQRIATNGSATLGEFAYTISNGASFTVTSYILGTPGTKQDDDVSSYSYFIVRPT
jgi:uncharacterized protein YoaH (UPF0181 family)